MRTRALIFGIGGGIALGTLAVVVLVFIATWGVERHQARDLEQRIEKNLAERTVEPELDRPVDVLVRGVREPIRYERCRILGTARADRDVDGSVSLIVAGQLVFETPDGRKVYVDSMDVIAIEESPPLQPGDA